MRLKVKVRGTDDWAQESRGVNESVCVWVGAWRVNEKKGVEG
jgi:hypothetical protein